MHKESNRSKKTDNSWKKIHFLFCFRVVVTVFRDQRRNVIYKLSKSLYATPPEF